MPISIAFPNVIDNDGQIAGTIVDFARNHGRRVSELLDAVKAERAALEASHAAALKAATDKATADIAAAQAAQKAAEDALSSFRQTAGAFLQQLGSVNHPEVAALVASGSAELAKPDNQRKAEALDAQIAALTAKKAALMPG